MFKLPNQQQSKKNKAANRKYLTLAVPVNNEKRQQISPSTASTAQKVPSLKTVEAHQAPPKRTYTRKQTLTQAKNII